MKEKKKNVVNVPNLRFPGFEGEWVERKLGNLGEIISGLTYSPKDIDKNGVLVLRSSNVKNNNLVFEDNVFVNVTEYNNVKKDDILLVVRNGSKRLIGKCALITENCEGMAFGAFMSVFRSDLNEFLIHWFWGEDFKKEVHKNLGATINSINGSNLKEFKLFVPKLSEQTKIAEFLFLIDNRISTQMEIIEHQKSLKRGLMQQLFSQQLRFKDNNGVDSPGWEEKRLGDYCSFFSGGTPISTTRKYYNGNIPFIGSGNISQDFVASYISEEALKNSSAKLVEKGDVLYALYGATSGEVAISKINGAINQAVLCIRTEEIDSYLLFQVLKMNKEKITSKYLQGGQGNLSAKIIRNLKLLIPSSKKEQTKIAIFLSSIDKKLEREKHILEAYKQQKKYLLQNMFV